MSSNGTILAAQPFSTVVCPPDGAIDSVIYKSGEAQIFPASTEPSGADGCWTVTFAAGVIECPGPFRVIQGAATLQCWAVEPCP